MTATQPKPVILGEGILNWCSHERVGDRYGAVHLTADGDNYVPWDAAPTGTAGTLTAVIVATRQSRHIGDLFRGIGPTTPDVGDAITLGTGTLFAVLDLGVPVIGLEPEIPRDEDWLDPRALYRCHSQTVRLIFTPHPKREETHP